MQILNTRSQFGIVSKILHWFMAFLIIGMLIIGFYMSSLPLGTIKLELYGWHKEFGILVLFLVLVRLLWRIKNVDPELNIYWLERLAARSMHWALYILMFAMPLTGWLLTSAAGLAPSFFGLFSLPLLISPDRDKMMVLWIVHEWLAYGLIAALCIHTAAALKHHFIDKDDILRRMWR